MSLNFWNNEADKKTITLQGKNKNKVNQAKQGFEAEKSVEKAQRKKKKKKGRHRWRKKSISTATRANATSIKAQKKKKKTRNASKITYYSCNKKGHFAFDCTEETKNYL